MTDELCFNRDPGMFGDLRFGAGDSQTIVASLLGAKATASTVYTKANADRFLKAKQVQQPSTPKQKPIAYQTLKKALHLTPKFLGYTIRF